MSESARDTTALEGRVEDPPAPKRSSMPLGGGSAKKGLKQTVKVKKGACGC